MEYKELKQQKRSELLLKLRTGMMVSRFEVYPHRKELRRALQNDSEALERLEFMVESVENTI